MCLALHVGSGDLDSGTCVTGTLLTKQSPKVLGSYSAKESITKNCTQRQREDHTRESLEGHIREGLEDHTRERLSQ